ncbi:MAG TPA: class I SAM-dependent methyltransferase [Steroidobacteraceae bacterium]|nr:class I SAM-dependent methyltransferase [Steroidobacteraceae bacterium]
MHDRSFDAAYYQRYYLNPRTRAVSQQEMDLQGQLIAAQLRRLGVPVRRILDAGCGLGLLRRSLLAAWPRARYVGVEVSEYLCERMGWVHGSVVDFEARTPFDLVICHDVPQYLDDRAAARAIRNLARLCRGALYFHVPTAEDRVQNIDPRGTDTSVYWRPAVWYQTRLRRHFRHTGGGLHMRRGVPIVQWTLEQPWR